MEELKRLCLKEGELIGELPPEMPLVPGEARPQMRRRVGTAFSISDVINRDNSNVEREEDLVKLEFECEIQQKIVAAALRLSNDPTASKGVRKQRKTSYQKSYTRLKEMESKLNDMRKRSLTSTRSLPTMGSTGEIEREPSQDSLQMADDDDGCHDDHVNNDAVAEDDDDAEIMINFPRATLDLSEMSPASVSPSVGGGRRDRNDEHLHNLRNQ
ncbi:PREDICTED: FERM domain-containing protein 4A-like, partial [Priapulus caudatus]|uniref:FERM domain-containing protein 4A-like n=1 Tax=Priapulus caudatus TaxID=37621 RepID=A0ABM1F7I4_PRICU